MLIGAAEPQESAKSAILPPLLRRATEVYKTSCFLFATEHQPPKNIRIILTKIVLALQS